jgi:branched-subunit amino acid aminotransferase/4-amino-4-deoxychorismate lyase
MRDLNFNVKSNNYLLRSYIATESRSKGGYLAIEADKNGYLLEGSTATVAILLKNGDFIIPPFDRILPGTTAIKIMEFLE